MQSLRELEPKDVFSYFDEICHIPHGSGNIEQVSDYCVRFAEAHGLSNRQEPSGNVIIWKDASPGYEEADPVMLQGHLDMVAVKTDDCDLDMVKEGLRPAVTEDGEWVYAEGTSLGADDGIAVAYALAILADDTLSHPALEAVFTVNEEIDMSGARTLDTADLHSRILLNMDSEEEGEFLTSCAGGAMLIVRTPATRETREGVVYEWRLKGLSGGHSGSEIHLGRANANNLFGRFLSEVGAEVPFGVGKVAGGEKDNAIADACSAVLVTDEAQAVRLTEAVAAFEKEIQSEYADTDPGIEIVLTRTDQTEVQALTSAAAKVLADVLTQMPAGVQSMEPDIPGMVRTSLNLGILRVGTEAKITYSVRSSDEAEKEALLQAMLEVAARAGGQPEILGRYPGWAYQPVSRIRPVMTEAYEELTGKQAVLTGIHAGVECGIFCHKLPGLDATSFGPTMRNIHTPREQLSVASVGRTYELLKRVLEKLSRGGRYF